ncbi:hypothetical protein ACCO45_008324 [Purpureocillium lilacinum]|uniref:Uncharacterized protein n=1 Tax=Purpureocillium lilacinum TaxID=33203 RepID=A0ACC4DQN2_PURLI
MPCASDTRRPGSCGGIRQPGSNQLAVGNAELRSPPCSGRRKAQGTNTRLHPRLRDTRWKASAGQEPLAPVAAPLTLRLRHGRRLSVPFVGARQAPSTSSRPLPAAFLRAYIPFQLPSSAPAPAPAPAPTPTYLRCPLLVQLERTTAVMAPAPPIGHPWTTDLPSLPASRHLSCAPNNGSAAQPGRTKLETRLMQAQRGVPEWR